ncbi:MAG: hypothetical protein R3341_01150 [Methylophaga sp.]|nr:hypothetical protein [Methylophaga sp.]
MTEALNVLREQQQQLDKSFDCEHRGFAILPDWQAVQVSGEDAESFLQNLLTNDVKAAQPDQAQLNGFCQAKGRLLAIFWLVRRADDFVLILPTDQVDFLTQRLNMFKLRSKVVITNLNDLALITLPDAKYCQNFASRVADNAALALVPIEELDTTLEQLQNAGLKQQARHCWLQALLQGGYPMIFAASRERFTAQQVNLDLAGGVSFRKGCYPGQEVVARLHYLGEAKRRLFIGEVQTTDLPAPGADINNEAGDVAGQLVQSCQLDAARSLIQFTLKLTMAEQKLLLPDNIAVNNIRQLSDS